MDKLLLILTIILSYSSEGFSSNPEAQMQEAFDLMSNENYTAAEDLYKGILKEDFHSAELYYNLGLANYYKKDFAEAVLYLEKAIKLKPNYTDAHKNLSFIRSELVDNIYQVESFFLWRILVGIANLFPIWLWTLLSMLCLVSMVAGLYFWLMRTLESEKKKGFILLLASAILFLITVSILRYKTKVLTQNSFSIVMEELPKYEGPNELSAIEGELVPQATKVRRLEEISGWIKVQLPDLEIVYVKAEMIEDI